MFLKTEKLWALIPAYNEEKTIKEMIMRTKKIIKNVLVVNDGSTDKTGKILKKIRNINIINIPKNKGKANALKTGINFLKSKKADKVITLDADLQHLPEEIINFLGIKADIIIGARKRNGSKMPFFRKMGNFLASIIIKKQLNIDVYDPQSGFRLYSKKAINKLDFDGMGFDIEKKILKNAIEKNLTIKETNISCIYNNSRKSYLAFSDLIDFLKN